MAHSIGKTIAELRKAKGWTQIELAEKLQVSDKTISKWEKDGGAPSIEFFPLLAKVFNISIDYLMLGKNNISDESINDNVADSDKPITNNVDIETFIHNDIVSIEQLLELKDFKLIKKLLTEKPIHIIEKLYSLYANKQFRPLFTFAIDNNDKLLATAIMDNNNGRIEKYLITYCNINKAQEFNINKKFIEDKIMHLDNIADVLSILRNIRGEIINELSLKIDKNKIVGDLTREYFDNELQKGNIEMVIIKLCVRLEAILRCDYHYDGDFSEMLKKYCDKQLTWQEDDGWGYMVWKSEDKTINLLNSFSPFLSCVNS